ncbi:MAG: Hpt domain-containing protein [Pseudomonadota bacterium]|nr:Hpt domain-containing protein [Pseudomonadota bacterium]
MENKLIKPYESIDDKVKQKLTKLLFAGSVGNVVQSNEIEEAPMIPSLRCRMEEHLSTEYDLSNKQVEAMVVIGCNDIKKNLAEIADIVDGNHGTSLDFEALRKAAHSLKGVLLNLGLKGEAEETKKIEDAAKDGKEIGSVEKILAIGNDL